MLDTLKGGVEGTISKERAQRRGADIGEHWRGSQGTRQVLVPQTEGRDGCPKRLTSCTHAAQPGTGNSTGQ